MTFEQSELINIVRNSSDPKEAIKIAIEIITAFLLPHESSPKPSCENQQELD
jgi:hypothetical protein